jgi:hypothetical protein
MYKEMHASSVTQAENGYCTKQITETYNEIKEDESNTGPRPQDSHRQQMTKFLSPLPIISRGSASADIL